MNRDPLTTTGATMTDRIDPRLAALTTLAIGTPVEGGFFAGYITMPDGVYGIAVAPKATGELRGRWLRGRWLHDWKDVPGARSCFDCRANTLAMAEAGSELAPNASVFNLRA